MDLSQVSKRASGSQCSRALQSVARQAETFARTVGRSAEATAAPLSWMDSQLRRDIPEAVVRALAG